MDRRSIETTPLVLIVVDRDRADSELHERLVEAGYRVTTSGSGEQALRRLAEEDVDIIVSDTLLPDISGLELCRRLCERADTPFIFVTEVASLPERLLAFDYGADDFIVQPSANAELVRRIRAVLRRRAGPAGATLFGPHGMRLDVRAHEVELESEPIDLTPKEFALLRLLLEHRGEVMSSDSIALEIWGHETFGSRNFVEAHVSRLRRKLQDAGASDALETVRGVGYVIRAA